MTSAWRSQPKPARVTFYTGGLGWVNPTPDSEGNARVEIAVRDGDLVIVVKEYTLRPDITAAEDLMLAQYDSL